MSAPSASATRSKVYGPGAVPLGTATLTVNWTVAGGVTGPRVGGVNEIHDAFALGSTTSMCTSLTVDVAALIRPTMVLTNEVPLSTPNAVEPPKLRAA